MRNSNSASSGLFVYLNEIFFWNRLFLSKLKINYLHWELFRCALGIGINYLSFLFLRCVIGLEDTLI